MRVITIKAKYETTVSAFDFSPNGTRTFTVVAISFCIDIKIVVQLKLFIAKIQRTLYPPSSSNHVPSLVELRARATILKEPIVCKTNRFEIKKLTRLDLSCFFLLARSSIKYNLADSNSNFHISNSYLKWLISPFFIYFSIHWTQKNKLFFFYSLVKYRKRLHNVRRVWLFLQKVQV